MYASTQLHLHSCTHGAHMHVYDVWVLTIYCRLHNIKWQYPWPWKHTTLDRMRKIMAIQSGEPISWWGEKEKRWTQYSEQVSWKWKFHHPLQFFCRSNRTHSYFLIKEVGRKQRHKNSVCWIVSGELKFAVCQRSHSKKMHGLGDP
jgi:hypothetical protein